jgi:hypothetical protein
LRCKVASIKVQQNECSSPTGENMSRALWQLLLVSKAPDLSEMTCEECFAILDYFAGQLADGADPEKLRDPVVGHLSRCPECRPKFTQ